jgi:hypothetical protein
MAARLSAQRSGRTLLPRNIIFLLLVALTSTKNLITSSGIEPATILLVAHCLNATLPRASVITGYSLIF